MYIINLSSPLACVACLWFFPTYISPHRLLHIFLNLYSGSHFSHSHIQYTKSKRRVAEGKKNNSLLLLLWKERAGKEGGRVSTTRQSYVWHPCSLKEGRTDTKLVRPSRRERGDGGREGRGNKCKKAGREKRVKKMHKSCISSCPQGTKNIVSVNGSWWAQAQGECDEKPGRLQLPVLLSTNPLSLCVCSCQLGLSLGMI